MVRDVDPGRLQTLDADHHQHISLTSTNPSENVFLPVRATKGTLCSVLLGIWDSILALKVVVMPAAASEPSIP